MAIRKNTKFIDPRYFMDEKTNIIKEELVESGGSVGNFGGVAYALGAVAGRNEAPPEDTPDSEIQRKATESCGSFDKQYCNPRFDISYGKDSKD